MPVILMNELLCQLNYHHVLRGRVATLLIMYCVACSPFGVRNMAANVLESMDHWCDVFYVVLLSITNYMHATLSLIVHSWLLVGKLRYHSRKFRHHLIILINKLCATISLIYSISLELLMGKKICRMWIMLSPVY